MRAGPITQAALMSTFSFGSALLPRVQGMLWGSYWRSDMRTPGPGLQASQVIHELCSPLQQLGDPQIAKFCLERLFVGVTATQGDQQLAEPK
jgi:hypothetical protein